MDCCLEGGPFYIIGSDTQMNEPMFKELIRQKSDDILLGRPALSHLTKEHREDYLSRVRDVRAQTRPRTTTIQKCKL